MIKSVNGGGRYITVTGGTPASTYINSSYGYMNVGDVRYNTTVQQMEVYDGQSWIPLGMNHANVSMTPDAERALDWANRKIAEEAELDRLAESNPTIADLVEQKKALDHKIKMVQTLVR